MLTKARLVEIRWDDKQQNAQTVPPPQGKQVTVQFNPQSLKLTYANENKGGDQPGGTSKQFVGSGTSKMSVELLFDTTEAGTDVRKTTEEVAYFIQAKKQPGKPNKRVPPGISFEWGTFIFRGVVDSMDETLDYFSAEGVPLRATVSLGISRQEIEFLFGTAGPSVGGGAVPAVPGAEPREPARPGDSVQKMAGRAGKSGDWKAIAAANNIDDPLRLSAGALVNLNVEAGVGLRAGVSAGVTATASAGVVASAAAGVSAGASVRAGVTAGASVRGQAGVTVGRP